MDKTKLLSVLRGAAIAAAGAAVPVLLVHLEAVDFTACGGPIAAAVAAVLINAARKYLVPLLAGEQSAEPMHFCNSTEQARGGISRWNRTSLTWAWRGRLPNLSDDQVRAAIREAFGNWQAVCGLTFREASVGARADITLTAARIDGPSGVLAQAELPPGDDRPLGQEYDTSERFVIAIRPPQGTIDLVAVATHEIGHSLGLDHDQRGTGSLMEPIYAPGRRTPQARDISRAQDLYGPPVPVSDPGPAPEGASGKEVVIRIRGAESIAVDGYHVTPV